MHTKYSCDHKTVSKIAPAIYIGNHAAYQQMPALTENHVNTMGKFKQPVLESAGTTRGLVSP